MSPEKKLSQLQRLVIEPTQLRDGQIILSEEQQHYLNRVLRLRQGDRFVAMNGRGQWWLTQLMAESAQILEPILVETELPISITLMVALPKGNGFDEVVRYSTELGVTCLVPVLSERTLLNPSPQKLERWRRIAQESAEQSERQIVPSILEPVSFASYLSAEMPDSHRYICVARGEAPHLGNTINQLSTSSSIIIATGPEGGWTSAEVEQAISAEFKPVSLGRRILRAVTAPIVALSLVSAEWESRSLSSP